MTSASHHTGANVASQADNHGVGESGASITVGSTGTAVRSATQDWDHGHGDPTPRTWRDVTGSRLQGLGNDYVLSVWKIGSGSGSLPQIE